MSGKALQQRSIDRINTLLDSAQALLEHRGADDISLADIAREARIPLPSTYHFFPNKISLFERLAQRFHEDLAADAVIGLPLAGISWQAMLRESLVEGARYQNQRPAMMRLFLGAGVSAEVRSADVAGNRNVAMGMAKLLAERFHVHSESYLEEKIAIALAVCDGVWQLSYSRYGLITEELIGEGVRAALSYLRVYLPEEMPINEN
ncbi:TetR/AcrR family transcriptional regulator [Pseudomonas sp. ICMP 561]|uniref:TetR/AcrR family transcriptional regulator n=1 Tax=Pseudomonas sp. ICMP 561 TaxID=1718918 RepID=UPI000C0BA94B|nr:TetR/AcrR family transcriptional regulator [Pseudomonas sp. ICMP 561]PHN17160.1 hypothetical protein AO242_20905 [Pseudomonas sp. ICMP 561]